MADAWERFLTHPGTLIGAGIMAGADPQRQGLGGLGLGIMNAAQAFQRQQERDRILAEQARQRAARTAFGESLEPQERLRFNVDPGAYMQHLYRPPQRPSDFMLKMGYAGGDLDRYREVFGPGPGARVDVKLAQERAALPEIIDQRISENIIEDVSESARGARGDLEWANQGMEYLRNLQTGRWAPLQAQAASWLGLDPQYVGTAEAFTAHTGEAAMRRVAQTKGSVSDKEMAYFQQLSPNMAKTREGNYILFELARRKAYRARDMRRYLGEYARKNNGRMAGFEDWYLKNKDPFPEFSVDQIMQQFQRDILGREPISRETEQTMQSQGLVRPR